MVAGFGRASSSGAIDLNQLTGVGDLGQTILAAIPAELRRPSSRSSRTSSTGIHEAFSLAIAQTFWLGVGAAVIAAVAAVVMHELPLRTEQSGPRPPPAAAADRPRPGRRRD